MPKNPELSPWFDMRSDPPVRSGIYEVSIVNKQNKKRVYYGFVYFDIASPFVQMRWYSREANAYLIPVSEHWDFYYRGTIKRAANGEILTTHFQ